MSPIKRYALIAITAMALLGLAVSAVARDRGEGPYDRLVVRGATIIDGTGAPPWGPADIVIEGDKITDIVTAGVPGYPLDDQDVLKGASHVIDARGMYVTPGFINLHVHPYLENLPWQYKLELAHGITTLRFLTFGASDTEEVLKQRALSNANEITAPRIRACASVGGGGWDGSVDTPEQARAWVQWAEKKGIDCVSEIGPTDPDLMGAYLDEANSLGLPTLIHIGFGNTMTARHAAELGLDSMTHFYGLFKSILTDHSIRTYPPDYNENLEYWRFNRVGWIADQSYGPGTKPWNDLVDFFVKKDFYINPTMIIYQFAYDSMKARNADWHAEYTLPKMWQSFAPSPLKHDGVMYRTTSVQETRWRRYLTKWMHFLYDFNLAGGHITVGTDSPSVDQIEGFSYIEEMILLEQAGLTPLEVIRSATMYGADAIFQPKDEHGGPIQFGAIRKGMKADLLVMTKNPLEDFKPLYGTGALELNLKTNKVERVRSMKYTIKDGIVYDSQQLLADVRKIVADEKERTGIKVELPALLHPSASAQEQQ